MNTLLNQEIKKAQIEETALFAINNIPEVHGATLKKFLELVNAGGTYGSISHRQLIKKMVMVVRYIPNACVHTLLILTDLLEIEIPSPQLLGTSQNQWLTPGETKSNSTGFFLDLSAVLATKRG